MVLDGLERRLTDRIRKRKSKGLVVYNPKINLIRYVDDCAPRTQERRF
jgi:hypothetical protein